MRWLGLALLGSLVLVSAACDSRVSVCVWGQQVECACPDGSQSVQVCNEDEYFDPCRCDGGGGSGTGAGGSGTGAGGTGGGGTTPNELASGSQPLIDLFVHDSGIYVVLLDEVLLLDRQGNVLSSWASARDITAAAFDGSHLGIADLAVLNMFDATLAPTVTANLFETCASAVIVSGSRFVCGPESDWQRIFSTFDALTGAHLASSLPYTYNGIPMTRVPGTDGFITVTTQSTPSDFHMYTVLGTDEASYVTESPYHGDFPVYDIYAFIGEPATHLVTHTGLLLLIDSSECAPGSTTPACFVQDGVLGTLSEGQRFVAMDQHPDGRLFGLVDVGSTGFAFPCEESGCLVQEIDSTSKTVSAQVEFAEIVSAGAIAKYDATIDALIIGYNVPASSSFDPPLGHRVVAIPF